MQVTPRTNVDEKSRSMAGPSHSVFGARDMSLLRAVDQEHRHSVRYYYYYYYISIVSCCRGGSSGGLFGGAESSLWYFRYGLDSGPTNIICHPPTPPAPPVAPGWGEESGAWGEEGGRRRAKRACMRNETRKQWEEPVVVMGAQRGYLPLQLYSH